MPQANFCHPLQFCFGENPPGRVLWIAQHKDARLWRDRRFKGIQIDAVTAIRIMGQFHFMLGQADIVFHPKKRAVGRGLHQVAVARF